MNTSSSTIPELGLARQRRPSTATNLSLFLPGLGQIYCGAIRRGLLHLSLVVALLGTAIVFLAMRAAPPFELLFVVAILLLVPTVWSAWDARRLALSCREDYRLKDYNHPSVYLAIVFLMMTLAVGLAFSIRENFLHVFVMAGDSMTPTLPAGRKVLVRKDRYRYREPERNDLVAFLNPADRRQTWVKRVIGLPGDTLEIREGVVHLNGEALVETPGVAIDRSNFGPIVIPEHHCFVLGDHRANSRDSRHIGPVPMIALVGQVVFVK